MYINCQHKLISYVRNTSNPTSLTVDNFRSLGGEFLPVVNFLKRVQQRPSYGLRCIEVTVDKKNHVSDDSYCCMAGWSI